MNEHDPLDDLLREWKSPDPQDELDRRINAAYRRAVRPPIWRRFWRTRITIPAPALASAALVLLALILWLHPRVSVTTPSLPGPAAVQPETRVTLADFQPVQQLEPHIMKEGQ